MIGEILKAARQRRGLSLGALALKSGVSKASLSRWEAGKSVPYIRELNRVMESLELSDSERRQCGQALEVPRALELAQAGALAGTVAVSSGELLRALRVRSGVSQGEVARTVGVTQSLVSRWETGECWPEVEKLHQFCLAVWATAEEVIFLTTRGWQHHEPLPNDKDALDAVLNHLEYNDLSPNRGPVYLALAGRYQGLYTQGKLSETEATDVWGRYAYYLCWRLGRTEEARQVVAPAHRVLHRTTKTLTRGQLEAVAALSEALEGKQAEATLRAVAGRIPERRWAWWRDFLAQTLHKQGLSEPAITLQNEAVAFAQSDYERVLRQSRLAGMLCDNRDWRAAVQLLTSLPRSADIRNPYSHSAIEAQNDSYLAYALSALGLRSEALRCLERLEPYVKFGLINPTRVKKLLQT